MTKISFGQVPSTSALFIDYLENWPRVSAFYPQHYTIEAIAEFARTRPRLESRHRDILCTALAAQQKAFGAGTRGVSKLADGAVAVVTGQQPGLFTGPNLSILKAITAVKLAAELEQRGIPAVPVFWVAADDHDYEEIQTTSVLNRDSGLCRVSVDLSNNEALPSGWMKYRADMDMAVQDCLSCLPKTENAPEVRALLESSYRSGVSPVDAFATMMAGLFAGTELILVNPLQPDIRALGQPAIDLAVRRNTELRSALMARNRAISEAGYHEQVRVDENWTGLFAFHDRSRQAVRPSELGTGLPLSPNVLLRPVMQDMIFPTVTYIAGPAEIAYFAQAAAVYQTLSQPMPPIFPRISSTIVEPRVARVLEKYGIGFTDLFSGRDLVKRKAVEAVQDGEAFDRLQARVSEELENLRPVLASVDPSLLGALETARRKMLYQVGALRTRYVNAAARRDETLERHLDAIFNSMYPEKKLQERVVNVLSFLSRYGVSMPLRLAESLSLDTKQHQLVHL